MHPLVHVTFLDVDVPVEVDDADLAVDVRRDRPDVRVTDRMVAAENDRKDALADDERDGAVDLVEGLLDVGRDHEHVAGVDQVQLFLQVDGQVHRVGVVEGRDAPDRLWAEAGPGPIRRPHVERRTDDGHLVAADFVNVLDERRFEERVDAGERRLVPARES